MLTTSGGQFHAHHFPFDSTPEEILIYLGRVRGFGTPKGTWLIYKREKGQGDLPQQWYRYDGAVKLADTRTQTSVPQSDKDYVRFY